MRLPKNTILTGVSFLLLLTLLQRTIRFVRSLLCCRWLEPQELGEWNIAYSFLLLGGQLAMFGLPAALGRYVEHYRLQGQLRHYLHKTTMATLALAALAATLIIVLREPFSRLLYGGAEHRRTVVWMALTLVPMSAFAVGCRFLLPCICSGSSR